MSNEFPNLPSGSKLQGGKYRIVKVLGQGGFGITYLAVQTGLGMKVAIKEFFLKGSCQRDSSTSEVNVPVTDNRDLVTKCQKKFKSEARKIASLDNDHIVSIIDIFDENGTSYYVMKYLSGGSLADRIKDGPLPEQKALVIIREIADALESIHSHGLLHLDIKPTNILFDERGRAVLIDFGVSKYVDSDNDTTTTSSLVGFSRGFAPLEQINATISSLTAATDLYALGATLYNLVAGVIPPEASQVMDSGLPEMSKVVSEVVKNAITQAMQPRRKDRPQDIQSFLHLLPEENLSPEYDEETVIGSSKDQPSIYVEKSLPAGRFWKVASVFLMCATVTFGVLFLMQNKGGGTNYKEEVKSLTQTNTGLQEQINTYQDKEKSLTQSNNSLRRQVEDLKGQMSTKDNKIKALQNENTTLKRQVDEYKPKAERWDRSMSTR